MKFIRIRSSIKKERERYYALYLIIYLQQMGVDMAEPGVGLSRLPQNRSLKFPSTSNPPRKNRKSLAHWSMANVTPLPPELLVTSAVATRLKLKARPPLVVEHSVRQWVFGTFSNINSFVCPNMFLRSVYQVAINSPVDYFPLIPSWSKWDSPDRPIVSVTSHWQPRLSSWTI